MAWLESFGRVHRGEFQIAQAIGNDKKTSQLPFGNGKSYGDTCLPTGQGIALVAQGRAEHSLHVDTGVLVADAHMRLSEIILASAPLGWFLPVTPGTKHVTLGGAVANDVHGKNHHLRGSFGAHIAWFDLTRSDGVTRRCSPTENVELFKATIGGMGLTGQISKVALCLMKVAGANILDKTIPFQSLDEYFSVAESIDVANEYAVAWIDQLATGKQSGRGLLFAGNHVASAFKPHRNAKLSIPFVPPISVLNGLSVRGFNAVYRFAKSRKLGENLTHYDPFFYPLDGVNHWNRLYGPRGLHQHQSIIPFEAARSFIPAMLEESRRAGQVSFLTVIKRFGAIKSPGILSFARPGYTLTLDFPHRGEKTLKLLDLLDRMTVECGGAVNPYKDSRMSPQTFDASFPNWQQLEAHRDPAFMSAFWQRTAMHLRGH